MLIFFISFEEHIIQMDYPLFYYSFGNRQK